ncbi:radical SAM protein, partial [Candidatus Bathyarchaeota archaeon]|nr:radical SAM protein [Candidatus Bathyarchaeota archaeon]
MCNVWRISKKEKELDSEDWNGVVDQLIQAFSVHSFRLVGGEPFLHPGFREVVHHIKARGCRLEIVSNGTLINEEIARFLVSENVDRVRLSVDGLQEIHDFYRGKGAFSKTMEGLRLLNREIEIQSSHAPKIAIQSIISRVNYKDIGKLAHLSKQLHVQFNCHYMAGEIESLERFQDPGFLENARRSSILTLAERENFEKRVLSPSLLDRIVHILTNTIRAFPIWLDCPRVANHFLIDPWGCVFPCEYLYEYCYGNCKDKSVEEIWQSQKRTILRQRIRKGNLRQCLECGRRTSWPPV